MKRNKVKETGVRRELFRLTHVIGYGSENMEEVFKEFMRNYVGYENGKGKIKRTVDKEMYKFEVEMSQSWP